MLVSLEALLLVIVTVSFGCFSYIAWFMPNLYRSLLRHYGNIYSRWDYGATRWITSSTFYWIMRIGSLLGFFVSTLALIELIW